MKYEFEYESLEHTVVNFWFVFFRLKKICLESSEKDSTNNDAPLLSRVQSRIKVRANHQWILHSGISN